MGIHLKIKEEELLDDTYCLYQKHAKVLTVIFNKINSKRKYSRTLIFDYLNIDLTSTGEITYLEITLPKNNWIVKSDLQLPSNCKKGRLILDPNQNIGDEKGEYFSNKNKSLLYVKFAESEGSKFKISNNIYVKIGKDNNLIAIWLNNIGMDFLYIKEYIFKFLRSFQKEQI